eukprot:152037-Karenia_brevis.AAC.1
MKLHPDILCNCDPCILLLGINPSKDAVVPSDDETPSGGLMLQFLSSQLDKICIPYLVWIFAAGVSFEKDGRDVSYDAVRDEFPALLST